MAAWDNVQLPQGPTPASYAGRLVDFSGIGNNIGNLYQDYAKGQLLQNQLAQQNAFKGGLPTDAQGNLDIPSIAKTIAQIGGVPGAMQAIPMLQGQQLINAYSNQQPPTDTGEQPQPQQRPSVSVSPSGFPVKQALEDATSIVYDSGPNAGRNIAPEVNAAGAATGTPTRKVEEAPTPAEDVQARPSALPPNTSETAARNLDKTANFYANRANIAERLKPGSGAGDLALSKQYADRATKMRELLASRGPEAVQFETEKDVAKAKAARSEKTYTGINAQATQYEADMRPYVQLSKSLLNDPAMYSGFGGQFNLDINRVRAALGDQKAAMMQEALQKVTANTVLGQINQQRNEMAEAGSTSGRLFAQQVAQVEKAAPQLATTLGGNRFLVETQQRIGELAGKRAELARDYLRTHAILDEGFDAKLSRWMQQHPLFTKEELADPRLIGAPEVPEGIAARGNAATIQWAHAMNADTIRTHNGIYKHPPPAQRGAPAGSAIAAPQQM